MIMFIIELLERSLGPEHAVNALYAFGFAALQAWVRDALLKTEKSRIWIGFRGNVTGHANIFATKSIEIVFS